MTTAMQVMLKLQSLPEEQQRQVLEFIERLQPAQKLPLLDPRGMFAGHRTTEQDIAEARREMWGNSPGEDY